MISAGAQIEYAVGIRWPEGTDTEAYDYITKLPDHVPEKHELMAHMLLIAVRKEWEMANRMREFQQREAQRALRRAEIRARKEGTTDG